MLQVFDLLDENLDGIKTENTITYGMKYYIVSKINHLPFKFGHDMDEIEFASFKASTFIIFLKGNINLHCSLKL